MGRPRTPKKEQRKLTAISLSPEALQRIKEYQAEHYQARGYRINRSLAIEAIIMFPSNQNHFS
jgi:hypothetical protein